MPSRRQNNKYKEIQLIMRRKRKSTIIRNHTQIKKETLHDEINHADPEVGRNLVTMELEELILAISDNTKNPSQLGGRSSSSHEQEKDGIIAEDTTLVPPLMKKVAHLLKEKLHQLFGWIPFARPRAEELGQTVSRAMDASLENIRKKIKLENEIVRNTQWSSRSSYEIVCSTFNSSSSLFSNAGGP